jgi:GNAT superfamily N-acetyltransferase
MKVRGRTEEDLDACVEMARAVHQLDGYPVYLPTDLRRFLASPDAYAAWVADGGGEVLGHVALHRRSTDAVMAKADEVLGLPATRIGVVARLLVAPTARRAGIGQALLDVATQEARSRGLSPVLDVGTELRGAIALYESCGWTRVGEVTSDIGDGLSVDEYVYLPPGGTGPPALS